MAQWIEERADRALSRAPGWVQVTIGALLLVLILAAIVPAILVKAAMAPREWYRGVEGRDPS